jgi:hypothetical protein
LDRCLGCIDRHRSSTGWLALRNAGLAVAARTGRVPCGYVETGSKGGDDTENLDAPAPPGRARWSGWPEHVCRRVARLSWTMDPDDNDACRVAGERSIPPGRCSPNARRRVWEDRAQLGRLALKAFASRMLAISVVFANRRILTHCVEVLARFGVACFHRRR